MLVVLQDKALSRGGDTEIDTMFKEDFGKDKLEIFKEFSEEPIAAASLAQVFLANTVKFEHSYLIQGRSSKPKLKLVTLWLLRFSIKT